MFYTLQTVYISTPPVVLLGVAVLVHHAQVTLLLGLQHLAALARARRPVTQHLRGGNATHLLGSPLFAVGFVPALG